MIPRYNRQNLNARRAEAVLVSVTIWTILAVPGGTFVYELWSRGSLGDFWAMTSAGNLAKSPIALFAYFTWLIVVTLFITPFLTSRLIDAMHPIAPRSRPSTRQLLKGFFSDAREFLGEISELLRTLLPVWPILYLLPIGIFIAIGFYQWFYLLPFLALVLLIAYKVNESRKTRGVEAYDEKHYTAYEQSLNEYLSLLKKPKTHEQSHPDQ